MTGPRPSPGAGTEGPDRALDDLDTALIGLRRLWAAPARLNDPTLGTVELSTIWIVDALERRAHLPETTVADLAGALDVAHSTASRLVDRAETTGAVTRKPSASDSRRTAVALTPTGRTLAQAARRARTGYLAAVTADWTPEQRTTLADLLTRLAAAVHTTPPHPPTPGPRTEGDP
jgi:DNA-binding MarR family transcriptional regulator